MSLLNIYHMAQVKKPVKQYYYSEDEWARLGCGPLPRPRVQAKSRHHAFIKGNPAIDSKSVRVYN